uniref:Transporter n=1 Tax=Macrostomum lignano TaxID=282301 RepID=A0A1I8F4K3_9PLAT
DLEPDFDSASFLIYLLNRVINDKSRFRSALWPIESAEVALKSKLDQPLEVEFTGDENKQRGNWTGKMDFMLSCIGYAVGLGNIWRFPYLCYKNGGGDAFLIPYFCFLILCGYATGIPGNELWTVQLPEPHCHLEDLPDLQGPRLRHGDNFWDSLHLLQHYHSLDSVLPCEQFPRSATLGQLSELLEHRTVARNAALSMNQPMPALLTHPQMAVAANVSGRQVTPSEEFWKYRVLNITSGIEDLGGIRWELFAALLVAWVLVFLCLVRGVKSSGKVVYVTAIFPYLVLILLCIRGVTLPGAVNGLKLYLLPKWQQTPRVHRLGGRCDADFLLSRRGLGRLITIVVYNRFRNNCLRDGVIVPLLNCGTSVFAGLASSQSETGSPIEDVVDQGPGLIFVVYPEALTKIFLSPVWSVLFFPHDFHCWTRQPVWNVRNYDIAFTDEFPKRLSNKKILITALLVAVEFGIGVVCVTRGGIFVLQIMDWYSSTFSLMIISFFECVVIGWIYGADRFLQGHRADAWSATLGLVRICWRFITPAIILWAINIGMAAWALMSLCCCTAKPSLLCTEAAAAFQRYQERSAAQRGMGPMVERFRDQIRSARIGGSGVAGVHGKVQREDEEDICLNPESSLKTVFASKLTVDSSAN